MMSIQAYWKHGTVFKEYNDLGFCLIKNKHKNFYCSSLDSHITSNDCSVLEI